MRGLVDWRRRPISKKRHGGIRATLFLHFMINMEAMVFIANMMNIVTYVHGTMHAGIASSANIVTSFVGAMNGFALLGAFVSDSFISRFKSILIFGPLEALGYGLLALQALVPSLHPPACNINVQPNDCVRVHGANEALFYVGLYVAAIGEGGLRSCLGSLGGDQFDDDDPVELKQKNSFFNWFTFDLSFGGFVALILIVWITINRSWATAFGVCALLLLAGTAVTAVGSPFYRNRIPQGSPLTRMLQVFVVAYKKRKLVLPENLEEMQHVAREDTSEMEELSRTKDFKFLDKAVINTGDTGAWSYCTVNQVEETKIILLMLPVIISAAIAYIPFPVIIPFTVQQGITMDTKIGKIHLPPGSLYIIPQIFQTVAIVIIDRLLVPFVRRFTGLVGGITNLQRTGIGFAAAMGSTAVAALVEIKRKRVAEEHGLTDVGVGIPMTVMWLGLQFLFLGILDVTSFVGLIEFCTNEVSTGMRSTGTAFFWCIIGLASLFGTWIVDVVNRATRHSNNGLGWLGGDNLNKVHLDRFYWLLTGIQFLALLNFMYWAKRYRYRRDQRVIKETKETGLAVLT